MGEFGIGQPVPREEDPYLVRGAGRYVDDVTVPGQAARLCAALAARARPHSQHRRRGRQGDAGRALVLTGQRPRDAARSARNARRCRASAATARPPSPAPQPAARRRARALRRRSGGVRRGRDAAIRPRMRPRRSRSTTRRCPRSQASRTRSKPGAPTAAARPIRTIRLSVRGRRQGRGRTRVGGRRPRGQASHGDQPDHHQLDGAARLPRRIRSARRPLHLALHGARPARDPPRACERSVQGAGDPGPHHLGECRRRLRHEGRALPRVHSLRRSRRSSSAGR